MASELTEYEDVLRRADEEASGGRYKDAYNLLGRGPWKGAPQDQEVRYRRGLYAYKVAHERLDEFQSSSSPKLTLIKAGCWLARSEAYLSSAAEALEHRADRDVEADLERMNQEQERFRRLSREFGESLFVSQSDKLNDD